MTSVQPGAPTWSFNDNTPSAQDKVDAAALDTQVQLPWAKINELITALGVSIRDDNTLVDTIVRLRNLHPEVIAAIDGTGGSWQPKTNALVATTANITLSGEQTIDGVLTSASRVVVKNQTLGAENGVYVSGAGAWIRATDADTAAELGYAFIAVTSGTLNGNSSWLITQATADITAVGTTVLTWALVSGVAGITPVAKGGTGASDAATARGNLGITMANIGISTAMQGVNTQNTLALAREAMGPWGDVVLTVTDRTLLAQQSDVINVKNYPYLAKGDGSTDDTAAIQAAINAAVARRITVAGMVNRYAVARVYFPCGQYRITASLTMGAGLHLVGDKAVLCSSLAYPFNQTFAAITGVSAGCKIDGLSFFGFTDGISIATGNADASQIDIVRCDFNEFSGTAIKTDLASASTLLNILQCNMYPRLATAVCVDAAVTGCSIVDCWVEGPCSIFFKNRLSMSVTRMLGVPTGAGQYWFTTYGPAQGGGLVVTASRFGAEGGVSLVDNGVGPGGNTPSHLIIRDCEIYTTSAEVINFTDLPDDFQFTGNIGLTGAYPFKFSAAIPSASWRNATTVCKWNVDVGLSFAALGSQLSTQSTGAMLRADHKMKESQVSECSTIALAQLVRNTLEGETGYGNSGGIAAGFTSGSANDIFGISHQRITGADAVSNYFYLTWTTYLTGLPAGVYTMVTNVEVTAGRPLAFTLTGSGSAKVTQLGPGRHVVSHVFYFDGTNAPVCSYQFNNVDAGTSFIHTGIRLFSGRVAVNSWNTVVYAASVPAAGYWVRGDRCEQLTPTVGQPKAWRCTVSGTPGTWVSEGNL